MKPSYQWIIDKYDLKPEEAAVFEWQFGFCGDFKAALWLAICKADEFNLAKLVVAFPVEVIGYHHFSEVSGWWQNVAAKVNSREKGGDIKYVV